MSNSFTKHLVPLHHERKNLNFNLEKPVCDTEMKEKLANLQNEYEQILLKYSNESNDRMEEIEKYYQSELSKLEEKLEEKYTDQANDLKHHYETELRKLKELVEEQTAEITVLKQVNLVLQTEKKIHEERVKEIQVPPLNLALIREEEDEPNPPPPSPRPRTPTPIQRHKSNSTEKKINRLYEGKPSKVGIKKVIQSSLEKKISKELTSIKQAGKIPKKK